MAGGHETPTSYGVSVGVDLIHVHRNGMVDTVTLPAVAADSVEISCGVELSALLRRQPAFRRRRPRASLLFLRENNLPSPRVRRRTRAPSRGLRNKSITVSPSTADKPREEQRFFFGWVE